MPCSNLVNCVSNISASLILNDKAYPELSLSAFQGNICGTIISITDNGREYALIHTSVFINVYLSVHIQFVRLY